MSNLFRLSGFILGSLFFALNLQVKQQSMSKTLLIITGPTAIGKTAIAIEVAKHYKTEIVSADSRQIYRCTSKQFAKA